MALNLIPNPASTPTSASQWTAFVAREDVAAIGGGTAIRIFTLTNEGTTARPEVSIGSIIEVGGSWYQADADTALTDDVGLVDGTVHIKLVPTGATVVPYLTSDAIPAFDSEKGGWYDGDDKFLPFEMTRSGAVTKVYTNKCEWINQSKTVKICNDGSVGLDGSLTVGGSATLGSGLSVGGNVGVTGGITCSTIDTGAGANEVYPMNQAVRTTDTPYFSAVISGTSALRWKTFAGTTGAAGTTTFAHGLGGSIIGLSGNIVNAGTSFLIGTEDAGVAFSFAVRWDATNITLGNNGGSAAWNSLPFSIVAFYI